MINKNVTSLADLITEMDKNNKLEKRSELKEMSKYENNMNISDDIMASFNFKLQMLCTEISNLIEQINNAEDTTVTTNNDGDIITNILDPLEFINTEISISGKKNSINSRIIEIELLFATIPEYVKHFNIMKKFYLDTIGISDNTDNTDDNLSNIEDEIERNYSHDGGNDLTEEQLNDTVNMYDGIIRNGK